MKVKAALTREKGKLAIETVELAEPKAGEVLVKLVASGICHTDTAVIEQYLPVTFPVVAGHEGVGVIEKVGPGSVAQTRRPRCSDIPSCGACEHCEDAHPYSCDDNFMMLFGGKFRDGTTRMTTEDGKTWARCSCRASFATYAIATEDNAIKVDVDADDLKKLCSLGCGVQTGAGAVLNRMKPRPGSSMQSSAAAP